MPHSNTGTELSDTGTELFALVVVAKDLWVNRSVPVLKGADLVVSPGQHLVILGPSGCGKTTILRAIAGLEPVERGEIWVGSQLVASSGKHVTPEKRRVGLVFQDGALFPHMSVAANIAYGLPRRDRWRSFGRTSDRGRNAVHEMLEMVGLGAFAERLPGSLSGGQQQRVAVARALVPRPSVLLFDESFSSLDSNLRAGVRSEVAQLLKELEITAIFVTHDQTEAFELGDEVAVMRDGVMVQQATPTELYKRPVDPWLAAFVGEAELLVGYAKGSTADTVLGRVPLNNPMSGPVEVLVRPEEVVLSAGLGGRVVNVDYCGHDALTTVVLAGGTVVRSRATGSPRFAVGSDVRVSHSGASTLAYGSPPLSQPLVAESVGSLSL